MSRTSFVEFMKMWNKTDLAICAEVGVAGGVNAKTMLEEMPNAKFYLVDQYLPYYTECDAEKTVEHNIQKREEMIGNVQAFKSRVHYVNLPSVVAARAFDDGFFDYVYIDGDHSAEEVRKDVFAWISKVKPGGMLAGHDWHIVGSAIKDILPRVKFEPGIAGEACDWWITK